MTSAAKNVIGVGLCLLAVTIVAMRLVAQDTYCPSTCPGNAGCQYQEAAETDWCQYPDTGCNGPVWTRIGNCCYSTSPILIDLSGDGFALTNAAGGVEFDFFAVGRLDRISWTRHDARNAWLVLDRNDNGLIESGKEMFGNLTEQPPAPVRQRNGFAALKIFDGHANGGNQDGFIDHSDQVYRRLRLWIDRNHNGISESAEMLRLDAAGVLRISLDYKESRYVDEFGNLFRYRAKVLDDRNADVGRFAFDVFLLRQPVTR